MEECTQQCKLTSFCPEEMLFFMPSYVVKATQSRWHFSSRIFPRVHKARSQVLKKKRKSRDNRKTNKEAAKEGVATSRYEFMRDAS